MIWVSKIEESAQRKFAMLATLALLCVLLAVVPNPAHAASTFVVNSTADGGDNDTTDNKCFTGNFVRDNSGFFREECTLRAAIEQANATEGGASINFNIPTNDPGRDPSTGVYTIRPSGDGLEIFNSVTIDGYTQPGAKENTQEFGGTDAKPLVELDGSQTNVSGLRVLFEGGDGGAVIRGLVINRFAGYGIHIDGGTGSRIEGNFIGTDASGTLDLGNGFGGVFFGGTFQGISGIVGGTSPDARNVISGNGGTGVFLGEGASGNKVENNLIGTGRNGDTDLGNSSDGVHVEGGSNNTVGDVDGLGAANTIAFNGQNGVSITLGTSNRILFNSIFSNDGLGIDLEENGVTANDKKDPDLFGNNLQNYPVITSAVTDPSSGDTKISGKLNSRPRKTFTIQLFSVPDKDPSGHGEGKTFLGQKTVKTNRRGNASFTFNVGLPPGETFVTATATNNATGDTSEFSAAAGA